ncbi:MAG TPA: ATP-binding protein [Thiobacillus sp.]
MSTFVTQLSAKRIGIDNQPKNSARPLFAGLLIMLVLVCTGTGVGIYQLQYMAATLDRVVREDEAARNTVNTMLAITRERALIMTQVISLSDAFDRDEKLLVFERLPSRFSIALQRQTSLSTSPEEKRTLSQQRTLITQMVDQFNQVSDLTRMGDMQAAEKIFHDVAIPTQSAMLDKLMAWSEAYYKRHGQMVKENQSQQRQVIRMMFGVAAISILIGLLVAWVVYRWNQRLIAHFVANATQLREALAQSAFRQQALDTHSIVSVTDVSGVIIHADDKFCEVSRYRREELVGQSHRILKSDLHPPAFYQAIWHAISEGQIWTGEICNRAKNGALYWVQSTIVPMLDEHKLPTRYISVSTEITQFKAMETSIREANTLLERTVQERTYELEEAKHQLEVELSDRASTQKVLQASYDDLKNLHRQLQETQQHLMQSEKLAAVGQLAAGMAHQINNPVGFIASNLSTLGRYQDTLGGLLERYIQLEPGLDEDERTAMEAFRKQADLDFLLSDTRDLLAESRAGIERIRNIVKDLRDFAHIDSDGQKQFVDINQCLDTTLKLLSGRFAENVIIQREYGACRLVECQSGELNQVFVNLLNNALQALQGKPGTITLRSGTEETVVWVEIEDTGEGIHENALPHIFEPFFTTRPVGQGAGLGLSTAYGMILQHGGTITVSSQPGAGSVFRVSFPVGHDYEISNTATRHQPTQAVPLLSTG